MTMQPPTREELTEEKRDHAAGSIGKVARRYVEGGADEQGPG
ncbi:MAG: hypothetical protein R3B97_09735 [Dehalococcoidia bacterium]